MLSVEQRMATNQSAFVIPLSENVRIAPGRQIVEYCDFAMRMGREILRLVRLALNFAVG